MADPGSGRTWRLRENECGSLLRLGAYPKPGTFPEKSSVSRDPALKERDPSPQEDSHETPIQQERRGPPASPGDGRRRGRGAGLCTGQTAPKRRLCKLVTEAHRAKLRKTQTWRTVGPSVKTPPTLKTVMDGDKNSFLPEPFLLRST